MAHDNSGCGGESSLFSGALSTIDKFRDFDLFNRFRPQSVLSNSTSSYQSCDGDSRSVASTLNTDDDDDDLDDAEALQASMRSECEPSSENASVDHQSCREDVSTVYADALSDEFAITPAAMREVEEMLEIPGTPPEFEACEPTRGDFERATILLETPELMTDEIEFVNQVMSEIEAMADGGEMLSIDDKRAVVLEAKAARDAALEYSDEGARSKNELGLIRSETFIVNDEMTRYLDLPTVEKGVDEILSMCSFKGLTKRKNRQKKQRKNVIAFFESEPKADDERPAAKDFTVCSSGDHDELMTLSIDEEPTRDENEDVPDSSPLAEDLLKNAESKMSMASNETVICGDGLTSSSKAEKDSALRDFFMGPGERRTTKNQMSYVAFCNKIEGLPSIEIGSGGDSLTVGGGSPQKLCGKNSYDSNAFLMGGGGDGLSQALSHNSLKHTPRSILSSLSEVRTLYKNGGDELQSEALTKMSSKFDAFSIDMSDADLDESSENPSSTTTTTRVSRISINNEARKKRKEAYEEWLRKYKERKREQHEMKKRLKEQMIEQKKIRQSVNEAKVMEWSKKKEMEAEKKLRELREQQRRQAEEKAMKKNTPKVYQRAMSHEDWLSKKNEEAKRRLQLIKLKEEEEALKRRLEDMNKNKRNEEAFNQWLIRARYVPKPVPIGQGLKSLRGCTGKIYKNPIPWQPLLPEVPESEAENDSHLYFSKKK